MLEYITTKVSIQLRLLKAASGGKKGRSDGFEFQGLVPGAYLLFIFCQLVLRKSGRIDTKGGVGVLKFSN
mgnify:CR=1 FL=1